MAVNVFVTWLCSRVTRLRLTDVKTFCKVFRRSMNQEIASGLKESRIGIESLNDSQAGKGDLNRIVRGVWKGPLVINEYLTKQVRSL